MALNLHQKTDSNMQNHKVGRKKLESKDIVHCHKLVFVFFNKSYVLLIKSVEIYITLQNEE